MQFSTDHQLHPPATETLMLSPARRNPPEQTGNLSFPEVDSFPIWEVFTQKKPTNEHVHAGSLSAPDASLAQQFAREHYGQDQ